MLASAQSVTKPFTLNIPLTSKTSIADAKEMTDNYGHKFHVRLEGWKQEPYILESMPPQAVVKASFTGGESAVNNAISGIETLKEQIREKSFNWA